MENFAPSYVCSPIALSGPQQGAHSALPAGTRTAFGRDRGVTGGVRLLAPVVAEVKGTTVSIASQLTSAGEKTVTFPMATAAATALLPISDVVVDDFAGIRTWSPPV